MSQYRLSHSTIDLLNTCERKFQIERLLVSDKNTKDAYPTTVFGSAFGVGVATYLDTLDKDKALLALWLEYEPVQEDDKRSPYTCMNALIGAFPQLDTLLVDWEPVAFDTSQVAELSFRLNIDEQFYYVGYIDYVLRNRYNGRHAVIEVKTTALNLFDLDPYYQNSGQAVGYSIILDKIAGEAQSAYDVIYVIAQIGGKTGWDTKIHIKTYPKTIRDRFNWFLSIGLDVERIKKMMELNFFPQRGGSCMKWNRACKHFGTCGMHSLDRARDEVEDTIQYQFVYELDEIIADHIGRV